LVLDSPLQSNNIVCVPLFGEGHAWKIEKNLEHAKTFISIIKSFEPFLGYKREMTENKLINIRVLCPQ
jgi:hypothetical protein